MEKNKQNPILMVDNNGIKPMYIKPEPKVKKMSPAEFIKYAADNHIKFTLPEDNRKYPGQKCQEPELNFAFRSLHQNIINQIINFCQNWHIYIDEIHLNADCLEGSIKAGSWQACTDSGFSLMKYSDEYKKAFWEMNKEYLEGKTKKDLDILAASQEPFMFSM